MLSQKVFNLFLYFLQSQYLLAEGWWFKIMKKHLKTNFQKLYFKLCKYRRFANIQKVFFFGIYLFILSQFRFHEKNIIYEIFQSV